MNSSVPVGRVSANSPHLTKQIGAGSSALQQPPKLVRTEDACDVYNAMRRAKLISS